VLRNVAGMAVALAVVLDAVAVIVAIRNGRRVRRLDRRLATMAEAPPELPRSRARRLRHRGGVSQGWLPRRPSPARPAAVVMGVAAVAAVGVGGWSLLGPAGAKPAAPRHAAPKPRALPPDPRSLVPANPPALAAPPRAYRVTILNASGIRGAAARQAPRLSASGYRLRQVGNAPSSVRVSVVLWRGGRRLVALHVARRLGIRRVAPVDGVPASLAAGADAIAVLGRDRVWRHPARRAHG
jgi:LytR cell envelope-related transcriptional attenuator